MTRSPARSTPRSRPAADHRTAASSSTSPRGATPSSSGAGCRRCTTSSRSSRTSTSPRSRWRSGPTCHYVMGGVEVDPDTEESIVTGLYAAGEVAGGMHGSNRLGGNSLSDLLVFGRRAGHNAAYAAHRLKDRRPTGRRRTTYAPPPRAALAPFEIEGGGENPYTIQKDLQDVMQRLVGIIRKARASCSESLEEIEQAQGAGQEARGRGAPAVQPGLAPRHRPDQHADRLRVHRQGGARARGVPRRAHPRRLPRARRRLGQGQPGAHAGRRRLRRPGRPQAPAAAGDARRARRSCSTRWATT